MCGSSINVYATWKIILPLLLFPDDMKALDFFSFSAVPYSCAEDGGAVTAITICQHDPSLVLPSELELATDEAAEALLIDPVSNMKNDIVYIFGGHHSEPR